jgi:hypothetical protein
VVRHRIAVAVAIAVLFAGVVTFAQEQGRTIRENWTGGWSGVLTSCPDGAGGTFDVWNDYTATYRRTTIYDKGGQIKQQVLKFRVTSDLFYNVNDPSKYLMGKPGENEEGRLVYEGGNFVLESAAGPAVKVIIPGYGPVFMETGRWVGDPMYTTLFNSGHNDFHDLINDGDPAAAEAFCNALK